MPRSYIKLRPGQTLQEQKSALSSSIKKDKLKKKQAVKIK